MTKSRSYEQELMGYLQDAERAIEYLNAALEEGDEALFGVALRNVAQARGKDLIDQIRQIQCHSLQGLSLHIPGPIGDLKQDIVGLKGRCTGLIEVQRPLVEILARQSGCRVGCIDRGSHDCTFRRCPIRSDFVFNPQLGITIGHSTRDRGDRKIAPPPRSTLAHDQDVGATICMNFRLASIDRYFLYSLMPI